MVGPILRVAGLALCVAIPKAQSAPQSLILRSVHVLHDGVWHADPNGAQTREQCRLFRLTDAAATRWFAASAEVDKHRWLEELDWTQCSASGTLMTADGKTYEWELDQSGRGRIALSPTVSIFLAGAELPFS